MGLQATAERRAISLGGIPPRDPALAEMWGYTGSTASGENVTSVTALQEETFMSGVRYLAETIASLPLPVYRRLQPRGKERATDFPLYQRLHDQPNRFQTSFEWRDMLMHHVLLRGNFYARINPDYTLIPYHPDRVRPFWAPNGERAYQYYPMPGAPNDLADRIILQSEMFHLTFMPGDGLKGKTLLEYQRDTIGRAMATSKYSGSVLAKGGRPGGVLKVKKNLSPQAKMSLREQWEERHGGASNAGRIAILEEDMDWSAVGMTNTDAQLMSLMELNVESMARILRIPEHKLGGMRRATFSNIEHQSIEAVVDSIRPWCVRIEQAMTRDLFTEAERKKYFVGFVVDGLLRGDFQSRMSGYATARQWGWLNADDVRDLEDMNPLPDGQGQSYLVPMNMVPAEMAAKLLSAPSAPTPPPSTRMISFNEGRSLEMMLRLRAAHQLVLRDAAGRLLRREADAVERQYRRQALEGSLPGFRAWCDSYYSEFRATFIQAMAPAMAALGDTIAVEAGSMVGATESVSVEEFVGSYVAALASRHISESREALAAVALKATPEAQLAAAELAFGSWRGARVDSLAANEAVRLSNAVSRFVWQASGLQQVKWLRAGDCAECEGLMGKVVGIRDNFEGDVAHPPLHDGCTCTLLPA
jgi:HK97 family phage portal protein